MEILADVAQHASFPPAEVELAKNNAIQGLLAREATPEFLAEKAFARAVYGDHPYRVVAPTRETLGMVSPELLKAEFSRRFRPERSLLVVVGDLNPAALSPLLARSFAGGKGAGEAPPATPPSPGAGGRRIYVVSRPGSVQSLILAGRPTVTATDPEYYPLLVANTIFSGAFSSRLVRNIREDKGYTYSPRGAVVAREQGGLLRVRADVRNEVTGASTLEIFYELDRMGATSPTPDELSRAKRYQAGLYLLRNQIQGAVARTLATNWVNGLPPQALGEFVTRINAVSAEQVKKVGQTFYPSATQTVVVVGDEAKIKAEMAQFGALTTVQP
jgi:predicted Zn-dependent peptidase